MNIEKLQYKLNSVLKQYPNNKPIIEDGIYGPATKQAIALFQVHAGLTVDGIAGPDTLKSLFPDDFSYDVTAVRPVPALKPGESNLSYRAMQYMIAQVGVRERTGNNDGTAVETFLRSVGLGKGYYWCMAFVYWAFWNAANDLKIMSRFPLKKTGGCMEQYRHCLENKEHFNNLIVLDARQFYPMVGDIFIIDLGKGAGHTGIITYLNINSLLSTVDGNTNDNGSANGDGVYERKREREKMFAYIRISS